MAQITSDCINGPNHLGMSEQIMRDAVDETPVLIDTGMKVRAPPHYTGCTPARWP